MVRTIINITLRGAIFLIRQLLIRISPFHLKWNSSYIRVLRHHNVTAAQFKVERENSNKKPISASRFLRRLLTVRHNCWFLLQNKPHYNFCTIFLCFSDEKYRYLRPNSTLVTANLLMLIILQLL